MLTNIEGRQETRVSPFFSIIVPVFNQWYLIPDLLTCLHRQAFSKALFEVLIVDNGSDEMAAPNIEGLNLTILHCKRPGSYAARNLAMESARGDWLVFTDADCSPRASWLSELKHAVLSIDGDRHLFAGQVKLVQKSVCPGPYEVYDLVKGIRQDRYVQKGYAATANLCIPKSLVERIGHFDDQLFSGGDVEFCRRATASGAVLHYLEHAIVYHPPRTSWKSVALKSRRIKGGHFMSAVGLRKLLIIIMTLVPPIRSILSFLRNREFTVGFRVIASGVQMRLWWVDILEVFRLSRKAEAERR